MSSKAKKEKEVCKLCLSAAHGMPVLVILVILVIVYQLSIMTNQRMQGTSTLFCTSFTTMADETFLKIFEEILLKMLIHASSKGSYTNAQLSKNSNLNFQ